MPVYVYRFVLWKHQWTNGYAGFFSHWKLKINSVQELTFLQLLRSSTSEKIAVLFADKRDIAPEKSYAQRLGKKKKM